MPFKRIWDATCPKVWETWKSADGAEWTIQDLPPEEDKRAVDMMLALFLKDENLCSIMDVSSQPASVASARAFFMKALSFRTSLACYRLKDGEKTLVAVNACPVCCAEDKPFFDPEIVRGERWKTVLEVLNYTETKGNLYKTLGIDKYLGGSGLIVLREYRGERLGARILNVRDKFCREIGLPATVTVFTGPASQKSAERCGFRTLAEVTFAELHQAGFPYDKDVNSCIKLMAKKFS